MISIHTNLSSIIAQNSLSASTNKLNQAIERMTTGYKVNHAKDNAAGYSIITDMTTKLGAYQVAEDNVAAGLDLLATANDTLALMQDKASRLQALSIQARNRTYGASSLDAINTEANAIISEINRLYNNAEFNGVKLLNKNSKSPKANPEYNWFIENPKSYTDEQIRAMTKFETIDPNTIISSGKYSIYTLEELVKLAEMTNAGKIKGGEFVLGTDIDLASIENWTPIGNPSKRFNGVFDGNGYVIRNLKIDTTNSILGLFGCINNESVVKNTALVNINVSGSSHVGGLVGYSFGDIYNCYTTGKIKGTSDYVGGLVADTYANIVNSYSTVETVNNINNAYPVGVLAGCTRADVINCFTTGTTYGYATTRGGLIGLAYSGNIINCYATGNVSGSYWSGGLIGHAIDVNIKDCYATGDIKGTRYCGGLVGEYDGNSTIINSYATGNIKGTYYVGGLVGQSDTDIFKSYSTGNVEGTNYIGSFVGQTDGNIQDCYTTNQSLKPVNGTDFQGVKILSDLSELGICVQVGTNASSFSKINFNVMFNFDLTGLMSGVEKNSSLEIINSFMTLLSEKQTELGAVQNRLESALDSIEVNIQNLTSSRSTLRDADIAKESARFVQEQILQEASATLLATANQTPAIALQLI